MTLETLTTLQWWIIGALYVGGIPLAICAALAVPAGRAPVLWRGLLTVMLWPFLVLCIWPFFAALEFTKGGR